MDDNHAFIVWAVRTRTLRGEIMHSLLSSGVLRYVGDLRVVGAPPNILTSAQLAEYVDATTRLRDMVMERIHLEHEHIVGRRHGSN